MLHFVQVQKQLKPELFGQLDDIVLFAILSFDKCKAAARLRLRDIASSMTRRGLIIYPSEAALSHILSMGFWWRVSGFVLCREWLLTCPLRNCSDELHLFSYFSLLMNI